MEEILPGWNFHWCKEYLFFTGIYFGNVFILFVKVPFLQQFNFVDDKFQKLFWGNQLILHLNKNFHTFQQPPTKHLPKSKRIKQNWTRPENLWYLLFVNFWLLAPKVDFSRGDWTIGYILNQFSYFLIA